MTAGKAGTIFARRALLGDGWAENVHLQWDTTGIISQIITDRPSTITDTQIDALIPGMANLHCHSFQRAMAGLAEISQSKTDSFWSWRKLMYHFVGKLTPKDMQVIAAFAYMEMLESGFTSVGEFQYIHNQNDGDPYDDPAEISNRIIEAAAITGIDLTLLPVFYAHSGFGGKPLEPEQNRFKHNVDSFLSLVQLLNAKHDDIIVGIAPHSLRAVTPDELQDLLAAKMPGPVHIHAAEQKAEIHACKAELGSPPIRWLLDNADIDQSWCPIHATHMRTDEISDLAKSGAIAGLCPITEANLGDGIFDGVGFLSDGGQFGIGSDSCVRIDLTEELRLLEYGQRLRDQGRAKLAPEGISVGSHLFRQAANGGAKALQQNSGVIAVGKKASFVSLDTGQASLSNHKNDELLDGWIFATQRPAIQHVWVLGERIVENGFHNKHDVIIKTYTELLKQSIS